MKKLSLILISTILIYACGDKNSNKSTSETKSQNIQAKQFEISYIESKSIYTIGDSIKIKVQIIEVSDSKVSLSLKRLTKDPWEDIKDKYKIGDKVKAKVIKFNEFGVFVEIMPMIQGLARVRGGTSFKDPGDSDNKVEIGKEYNFTITNFEPLDHKLGLELND